MEQTSLFQAVGEIDDSLLLDAEAAWERGAVKRRGWMPWLAAAACFLLVTAAVCRPGTGGEAPVEPYVPAVDGGTVPPPDDGGACGPADLPAPVELVFNDLAAAPDSGAALFSLAAEDFAAMSYGEVLDYFGVSLPVEEALPELALTGGGCFGGRFGVYRTGERGIYFDANSFSFSDSAGNRTINISLRTKLIVSPGFQTVAAGPEKIGFTRVEGWDLALFRYAGEDGRSWCHTEFWQDGVAWSVTAAGLTEDELARALESVLEEKPAADGPVTAAGTVSAVDSRYEDCFDGVEHHYTESHDYIQVLLDGGEDLTVWLPGEADRFQKGDRVAVTYRGEPATIRNIWPGQLEGVTKE